MFLAGFPALRQQHSLTCESSAASMGTRGVVTESQLMSVMPRAANPNFGFRGNPDGEQGTKLIDYGVYAGPVHNALTRMGYSSVVLSYASDANIRSYINRGWPVVAWVTYALAKAQPRVVSHNGVSFVLVPHEHAVLITGYDGATVYANDPWTGKGVRYYWSAFNRGWGYFGNMGLAIQPCPAPTAVSLIQVSSVSGRTVTWTWAAATNAAQYNVTITRHGSTNTVVYQATQTATSVSYAKFKAGVLYDIAVTSVSSCGGTSAATQTWFQMPPPATATPSPTPSPTSSITPVAETTATATPVASNTVTATPVVTSTP
jgi:uncharacterized protein YvpB